VHSLGGHNNSLGELVGVVNYVNHFWGSWKPRYRKIREAAGLLAEAILLIVGTWLVWIWISLLHIPWTEFFRIIITWRRGRLWLEALVLLVRKQVGVQVLLVSIRLIPLIQVGLLDWYVRHLSYVIYLDSLAIWHIKILSRRFQSILFGLAWSICDSNLRYIVLEVGDAHLSLVWYEVAGVVARLFQVNLQIGSDPVSYEYAVLYVIQMIFFQHVCLFLFALVHIYAQAVCDGSVPVQLLRRVWLVDHVLSLGLESFQTRF